MNLIKMIAVRAFEEMDGIFEKGETFLVNEERAFVLRRLGHAENAPPEPVAVEEPAAAPNVGVMAESGPEEIPLLARSADTPE